MKRLKLLVSYLFLLLFVSGAMAANKEFPGRDIYLGTEYIELADFEKQFEQVIVVDVRSKYEYETLKVVGAQNIALNSPRFIDRMRSLRDANPGKKLLSTAMAKPV